LRCSIVIRLGRAAHLDAVLDVLKRYSDDISQTELSCKDSKR
jgi:hypothetical protein